MSEDICKAQVPAGGVLFSSPQRSAHEATPNDGVGSPTAIERVERCTSELRFGVVDVEWGTVSDKPNVQGALSHVFIAADDFHGVSKIMQLLGLDVLMGDPSDDGNYVRFGGNGGFHAGLESSNRSGNRPMIQLNIRVPDADAAQQLLVQNGIDAPEPRQEPWGAKHCQFTVGSIELALTQD